MSIPLEIERKFLIRCPQRDWLFQQSSWVYQIRQTYLQAQPGCSARVRARTCGGVTEWIKTEKRRLTDRTCQEQEEFLTQEQYEALLRQALPDRRTICKTRYCLPYEGFLFEIDLYDFWQEVATMEVELPSEETVFPYPPGIEVLRELTGDHRFSNLSLAKEVPDISADWKG